MSLEDLMVELKARGNFGHKGRPGKRGGSMPKSGGRGKFPKEGSTTKINGVSLTPEASTLYSEEKSKLKTSIDRQNFDQYIYQRAGGRSSIEVGLVKEAADKTQQLRKLRHQDASNKFKKISKM